MRGMDTKNQSCVAFTAICCLFIIEVSTRFIMEAQLDYKFHAGYWITPSELNSLRTQFYVLDNAITLTFIIMILMVVLVLYNIKINKPGVMP